MGRNIQVKIILGIGLWVFLLGCRNPAADDVKEFYFVTQLGMDTISLEKIEIGRNALHAEIVKRSPRTTFTKCDLSFDENFQIIEYRELDIYPFGESGDSILRARIIQRNPSNDSLQVMTNSLRRRNSYILGEDLNVLPWFDLAQWPFMLVLQKMNKSRLDSIAQVYLSNANLDTIRIARQDSLHVKVWHPRQGVLVVNLSDNNQISELDAQGTTKKWISRRTDTPLDLLAFARRYTQQEAKGSSVRAVSTRGKTDVELLGAAIHIDYGQPSRRGRELFGALVPYGKVWRTGANLATHFTTDKDLLFDKSLKVPAGTYTLFTIPEITGGILIFNKQTGQSGVAYNRDFNLGTVPMAINTSNVSEEFFTIDVFQQGNKGVIQFKWGNVWFEVTFEVLNEG